MVCSPVGGGAGAAHRGEPDRVNIVLVAGLLITILTAIPVLMQLRGHPRGLFVLFFAEMWERFSYYGMRALLIYYLTQHFLFEDKAAASEYGAYTTLIWLMPLVGGVLADRYLGNRKAIVFSAALLTAGQLLLAVQGPAAQQVLTYQGHAYAFQATGRGGARHVQLKVGDRRLRLRAVGGRWPRRPGAARLRSPAGNARQGALPAQRAQAAGHLRDAALSGPVADCDGHGFPEGQHHLHRGPALSRPRPPARRRLHPLLLRHEPGGLLGGGDLRGRGRGRRLVGRLRPGRARHGGGAGGVRARPPDAGGQGRASSPARTGPAGGGAGLAGDGALSRRRGGGGADLLGAAAQRPGRRGSGPRLGGGAGLCRLVHGGALRPDPAASG